jgi:hypothetical protein
MKPEPVAVVADFATSNPTIEQTPSALLGKIETQLSASGLDLLTACLDPYDP